MSAAVDELRTVAPEVLAGIHERIVAGRMLDAWELVRGTGVVLKAWPAHEDIARALESGGDDPWVHVMHSLVLEKSDRYGEALEAARRAVALQPRYGSAVLQCAENLIHLGRDDEAVGLLEEADGATQNAAFALRLQSLYSEREDHVAALRCLETIERRLPLAEASMKQWIAGRRADFLYLAGDIDGCLEWCDRKGEGFQKRFAKRLREPGARERRRVRLEVPFTLTTQAVTSAHLQACIGYDERCGMVLLGDPTERHFVEMFLDGLLADHPLGGPRCMVMIPPVA
jgi:tetratricopeptide (TPR) repeat protein